MPLTPGQKKIYHLLKPFFHEYKVITIKGECCSGKDTVCQRYLRNRPWRLFDLTSLCALPHRFSAQDTKEYLGLLQKQLLDVPTKRKRYIYIRRIDHVTEMISDFSTEHRHLFTLVLNRWLEQLPDNLRVIITTNTSLRIENVPFWAFSIEITPEDGQYLLERAKIEGLKEIAALIKNPMPGHVIEGLRYARAMKSIPENAPYLFNDYYKEGYYKVSGAPIELEKEIPKPIPTDDLVGLEDLLKEMESGILNPIRVNHPDIPVKKGFVLCGPPGSGKSSIGRWLAHQLKGKLYLIGGEAGVQGPTLVKTFEETVNEAHRNSPAVVFLDDVDTLFGNADTYRAFLTILDGLDSKKRSNICVIVTCMSLKTVPSSLIRGGRLEMCLFTRLPNLENISRVLEKGFQKVTRVRSEILGSSSVSDSKGLLEDPSLVRVFGLKMLGLNYADIRRCLDDVIREIAINHSINLKECLEKAIQGVKQQYQHCAQTESTNIDMDDVRLSIYN